MGVTVYVGNLPWAVGEDELAGAFAQVGQVTDVRIIADPMTGRSRGFGFVELSGVELPEAIERMNGYEIRGRRLMVAPATPRPARH